MTATETPDLFDLGHVTAAGGWDPTRGFFLPKPTDFVACATKTEAARLAKSIGWDTDEMWPRAVMGRDVTAWLANPTSDNARAAAASTRAWTRHPVSSASAQSTVKAWLEGPLTAATTRAAVAAIESTIGAAP